jgi:hypothetical protein
MMSCSSSKPVPQPPAEDSAPAKADIEDKNLSLTLKRVDYALNAIELLSADWPWLSADASCIVVTTLDAQYLLHCTPPEGSPYRESSVEFRNAPVYVNNSDEAVLGSQSAPYKDFVVAVPGTMTIYHPANAELTGFAKEKPWFFISSIEALIDAHPAFDDTTRTEQWLSMFVHEFFHTRQFLQPSAYEVWGEMLRQEINPAKLNSLYLQNEPYKAAVDDELKLMSDALQSGLDATSARATLVAWLEMRRTRIETFSSTYPDGDLEKDDMVYTYIEGVARYVENTFMVRENLHPSIQLEGDPRFTDFEDMKGKGYEGMWQKDVPAGGKYYYPLGLHVGLLLDIVEPTWTQRVHEHPRWIVGLVEDIVTQ